MKKILLAVLLVGCHGTGNTGRYLDSININNEKARNYMLKGNDSLGTFYARRAQAFADSANIRQ